DPRAPPHEQLPLPVQLNVDLDLGSNLSVRMQGLEGRLTGRINVVTSKEGELRSYGKLTTVNATFYAYGQKLQVDPGVLIFDGPIENPALQVTAWRRNQAVEAGVQLSGTMRAPIVQIVSQPQVSEGERLSWLVLGRLEPRQDRLLALAPLVAARRDRHVERRRAVLPLLLGLKLEISGRGGEI